MALINCPECNKEISDKTRKCPHCGYPIKKLNIVVISITILIFILIILSAIYISTNAKNKADSVSSENKIETDIKSETPTSSINGKVDSVNKNNQNIDNTNEKMNSNEDEFNIPDNLTKDEKEIVSGLQGTWQNDSNADEKLVFRNMGVQYANTDKGYGYKSELTFIKSKYTDYLIQANSAKKENNAYLYNNDKLNIYNYDGKEFSPHFNGSYTKISDSNEFLSLGSDIASDVNTILETLNLPENLTDKQKVMMAELQGTWQAQNYNEAVKLVFNNMQVQYFYNGSKFGYGAAEEYVYDLKIETIEGKDYIIEKDNPNVTENAFLYEDSSVIMYNHMSYGVIPFINNIDYSEWIFTKISNDSSFISNPKIGMTKDEVQNSLWGLPQDINKTTTANSVSEQWVYDGNRYIYFDNGIVTAIQE